MGKSKGFSKKEIQEIISLYCDNQKSTIEIGEHFSCSYETIRNILSKNNVARRKGHGKLNIDEKRIIELYTIDRMSCQDISQIFGCSNVTIASILKRNKVQLRSIYEQARLKRLQKQNSTAVIDGQAVYFKLNNTNSVCIVDLKIWHSIKKTVWHEDTSSGYVRKSRGIKLHHIILLPKKGYYIDHINRNKLDNRSKNLRYVTPQQSSFNRDTKNKMHSSKFKGVYWHKRNAEWCASIRVRGKLKPLGYFDSEINAALAYDRAALKYFGQHACTNKDLRLL